MPSLLLLLPLFASLLLPVRGFVLRPSSPRPFPPAALSIRALARPELLEALKLEYDALVSSPDHDKSTTRFKELDMIVRSRKALLDIENDLRLFDEHIAGNDENLKETSLTFKVEFEQCREDIENQLNIMLDSSSIEEN